jgi:hypothetical protein
MVLKAVGLVILFATISCATYQGKVHLARNLIREGRFTDALAELKPLADQPSNDQLVYLLDYATALQVAGEYQESNKYFHAADKLSDIQDYTSLSLETGSFLLGEEMVQYKGDDFEIILLNAMSAINYLNLGDLDNAMVEVRRLNEKLRRFRLEANRKFTDNALALYLSAIIYEASKSWDDAAIAYENVYKVDPNYEPLREDLIRANTKARRFEAVKKWKSLFPEVVEKPEWKDSKLGEVVVIYQQGWGPRKDFRYDNMRYPAMYPIWSSVFNISPKLYSVNGGEEVSQSQFGGQETLFDVEKVAVASLEAQYLALVARRIGGAIVKEVVAERLRKENQLVGDLALLAMYASDRADLRQWSTLPRSFKIYRASVPPGEYQLRINGEVKTARLAIKPGGKVFVSHRTFQ